MTTETAAERVTPSELARRCAVSRQAVHAAIRDGRVSPPGPDGLVDLEKATAEFRANRHPTVGGGAGAAPDGRGRSHRDRYWKAKALREEAEAGLSEMKRAELARSLVQIGDMKSATFAIGSAVRDSVLTLPGRLAAAVAAAVRDALTAAQVDPAVIEAAAAATTAGAARVLEAEGRRLLVNLSATVRGMSAADAAAAAVRWDESQ